MAFPIPSHLPRKGYPRDIYSTILSKLDDVSLQTLNAQLASAWLAELDEEIQLIKVLRRVPSRLLQSHSDVL